MRCFYKKRFPIKPKEYRFIVSYISSGLKELMKCCSILHKVINHQQTLYLDIIQFISYICTNKHIRRCFYSKRKITPHGKTYWISLFSDINWSRAWLVPFKFLISNKFRELHLKLLHNIYPTNAYISEFSDTDDSVRVGLKREDYGRGSGPKRSKRRQDQGNKRRALMKAITKTKSRKNRAKGKVANKNKTKYKSKFNSKH